MLLTGLTGQEIGVVNRESTAITHPRSQTPGYSPPIPTYNLHFVQIQRSVASFQSMSEGVLGSSEENMVWNVVSVHLDWGDWGGLGVLWGKYGMKMWFQYTLGIQKSSRKLFGLVDVNASELPIPVYNNNRRGHSFKLFRPTCKSSVRFSNFTNRVVYIWNNLPSEKIDFLAHS